MELLEMGINDKPSTWKEDIAKSVDMYNDWFMKFAPEAFRSSRIKATDDVLNALKNTANLTNIKIEILKDYPDILPTLRMSTCPPLAVDRLIGLANVSGNLVKTMEEKKKLPARMASEQMDKELGKISTIIKKLADPDIFIWLDREGRPSKAELYRAATIVADRLSGSVANPTIRNEQEKRQLKLIEKWLIAHGYKQNAAGEGIKYNTMKPGTFAFRMNIPVRQENRVKEVNIPVDVVIMSKSSKKGDFPILFEAKSAGDFTNVNKRRKEEATKIKQLRDTHGREVQFNLFLCGYFDSGYLGYEAAEGIDWVWEHRIDDFSKFGI